MSFACTQCGSPCSIGDASVIFHADGAAGALCSPECATALTSAHPELVPMLDAPVHGTSALDALAEALLGLQRARSSASSFAALPLANAALFVAGAPVRLDSGGSATEQVVMLERALEAEEPLQQAVLHLCALRAHRLPVREILNDVAGCDVGRLEGDPAAVADRLEAMITRVRKAGRALQSLGFRRSPSGPRPSPAPALAAPVAPPRRRSLLARNYGVLGLLSAVGVLGASAFLIIGASGLAAIPAQEHPSRVRCGTRLTAATRTWLRVEGCSVDRDGVMEEVEVERRTQRERSVAIFVPIRRPGDAAPWAYVRYGARRDLSAVGAASVFEGTLDGRRVNGRPVIVEGDTPFLARLPFWLAIVLGVGGAAGAIALGAGSVIGRRRAFEEAVNEP